MQALLALCTAGLIFVIAYDLKDSTPNIGDRIVKKFISEQNWMSGDIIHYVQSLLGNV